MVCLTKLISSCYVQPTVIGTATVDLNYTTYEGLKLSNGVNSFRGMRYAAAPIGNLRWRAPVDPIPSDPGTVEKAVAVSDHAPESSEVAELRWSWW